MRCDCGVEGGGLVNLKRSYYEQNIYQNLISDADPEIFSGGGVHLSQKKILSQKLTIKKKKPKVNLTQTSKTYIVGVGWG